MYTVCDSLRAFSDSKHFMFVIVAVFTKEWITFRRMFRIAISFVIGIVIWTTCVHMHRKCRPNHEQDLRTARYYCAVRADWPMHGLSVHFQNAHARITFRKSFAFTCPRIRLSMWITIQNALLSRFKSLIWKSFAFTKGKIGLSNQERAE